LNILWISGSWDGGERGLIAHTIAGLWQDLGHRLTYWPLSAPRDFVPGGMAEVLDPPAGRGLAARLQFLGQLRRGARTFDAVLVEQDLATEFQVAEVLLGLRSRPLLCLLAHYPLGYYLAGRGEHNIARERKLAGRLLPRFDRVLALAPSVAADLSEHFGVPRERVRRMPWPAPPQASRRPDPGAAVAVVGHITPMKGVEGLLRILADLPGPHPAPRVHLFGGGNGIPSARNTARDLGIPVDVHPLAPGVAEDLAARANLFYGPQWLDGTGFDYVTAAAAGLPLAGLAAPTAPAEILLHGTMGRLAGLGEPAESGRHLAELIADPRVHRGFQRAASLLYGRHAPGRVKDLWAAVWPPEA